MISCTITVKEVKGKGFMIDMKPDQGGATQKEIAVASCIEYALRPVFEYLMSKGEKAEEIRGYDVGVVEQLSKKRTEEWERGNTTE